MCDILVLITLRALQRVGWRFRWTWWRWMELGAQFSNTLLKFCCKAIISWRFIISFKILSFHINLMISSKDISASRRLKCSLDIFFMLRILQRNSSTLKKVLEPLLPSNSCLISTQSSATFPCLLSYWWSSFHMFSRIGLIFGSKFNFCTNVIVFFFWFWNSHFLSGGTFKKSSNILFKTRFAVSSAGICWRGCFLCF